MLGNYITVAFRNLIKHKLFSLINVLGLSVSMACVILITLFIRHETGYDRHWEKSDRSYKVMTSFLPVATYAGLEIATSASIIATLLQQDFPQVETALRLMDTNQLILGHPDDNTVYNESGILFADANVHEVFNIPMVSGSWDQALTAPSQMVINQALARKYFGDRDPVGQRLIVGNQAPMLITGVMQDLPSNTHLDANAFISMATAAGFFGPDYLRSWTQQAFHTYVVLEENYSAEQFRQAIPEFLTRYAMDDPNPNTHLEVLNVADVHLRSQREFELQENGSLTTVYTFSALAVFILLIACCNFINLSTARSARRAREVGMRKTLGARRWQLVSQFLVESVLVSLVAVVMALGLVEALLPSFNATLNLDINTDYSSNPQAIFALGLGAIAVGLLAGSYPAFFLSSITALSALQGAGSKGRSGAWFRQVLVIFQFAISITLMIAASVVISQLRFANSMDLGFNREQVAIYPVGGGAQGLGPEYDAMKQELLRHPDVISVTAANLMPGDQNSTSYGMRVEGAQDPYWLSVLNVDYDFFETFDIDVIAGRTFSRDRNDLYIEPSREQPDTTANYVISASAARALGYTAGEAVDKPIEEMREDTGFPVSVSGNIVGVVEDIHFSSLREAVQPTYYRLMNSQSYGNSLPYLSQMAVRFGGNNADAALAHVEQVWRSFLPKVPFQQIFLEQTFVGLYQAEQRQGTIFTWFSSIAIFIAGLGLYGLASFVTQQRTREIGIRKVLGSTALQIVNLLTRKFTLLVLTANLIAWPVAWYFMNEWLQNFAYRTDLGIRLFLLAGLLALLIAVLTVGSLALRTAWQNPVIALRYE